MEFWKGLVEILAYLWPLETVSQWQEGNRYRFGRFRQVLQPGTYRRVPFFEEIRVVAVVPGVVVTPRLDITLSDGTGLTYIASATVRVKDSNAALNGVDDYAETTAEVLASVVSYRLAKTESKRITGGVDERLLTDLTKWVNAELDLFGVEAEKVRFVMLVPKPRTLRLIGDIAGQTGSSW